MNPSTIGFALFASLFFSTTVASAEQLVFGNEGSYPPFSLVDASGKLTGVEPELAREMCKRMKADCEIVVMDFKALIPALLAKKLDGVTTQIKPLPERKEKALFGMPIVYNPDSYIVRADSHYQFTKTGLQGVRFGIQRGSAQSRYLTEHFGDAIQLTNYDNPDQIRLDLLAGRIDATLGPKINWTLELISKPEGKDWKLDGGELWTGDPSIPEAERGSSWIVRKDNPELVKRMNEALASMLADCTFTHIRERFIPVAIVPAESACTKPS
ncbi:transporter substrate-binding domain-containing protein [Pseudomonas typographi]|uniref:Transporter substrate-binding domain-containing protein n=1 Tax=Pseudomonas typographi TaxID=2715964 RepID=A0ABR7Z5V0_9PSED|nr:transporter substrate-binding domain-containing protein [Pseudomonas typographi]MBD1554279.1 transporter substrate-binding domain-containing protein [Pseudomonas typographi]MBD1589509.1 transporter substrate-binding domain-containing protein [Pseudomonas typographi]MBD1600889.1 transporter substrate-binding domain-containing protein [Pseudomonas typographi]